MSDRLTDTNLPRFQLAMWTVYKREIIALEKENEEFLRQYYRQTKAKHDGETGAAAVAAAAAGNPPLSNGVVMPSEDAGDDEVELDSDEEMPQKPK